LEKRPPPNFKRGAQKQAKNPPYQSLIKIAARKTTSFSTFSRAKTSFKFRVFRGGPCRTLFSKQAKRSFFDVRIAVNSRENFYFIIEPKFYKKTPFLAPFCPFSRVAKHVKKTSLNERDKSANSWPTETPQNRHLNGIVETPF